MSDIIPVDDAIIKPFGRKAYNFIMRPPMYDRRITILEGSVRSSKTFAVDTKLIVHYSRDEALPLPSNAKRFICGASKQTVYRNMLLDMFSIVGKNNYSYNMASGELWIFGKQWFVVGAKDEASYKQILGSTVGVCISDETVEYPKSFLAQMFMRMSPDNARFVGTTNPGNPYSYLKAEVIDNPDFAGTLETIHFTLNDNPNISSEAKAAIIASQKGVFKLRYIDGLWVVAEGAIYRDSWNEQENLYNGTIMVEGRPFQLQPEPPGLRARGGFVDRWYSVDPGVDHVQSHLEFIDDGDIIRVTREQRWDSRKEMRQKTDGQYADDLEEFMGGRGYQVILPPEAASLRAELVLRGFWVTDANNEVSEGIHTVSSLLARRKLIVNKDECPELAKRIPTYAWDEKAAKRGDEQPLKMEDDDCDALRYGVHEKIPQYRVTGG